MTAQASFFDAPRDSAEVTQLRARIAALEADLAALQKPKRQPRPFIPAESHLNLLHVLKDGAWHNYEELRRLGGRRFGARLLELRQAGRLVSYESRYVSDDSRDTEYRAEVAR